MTATQNHVDVDSIIGKHWDIDRAHTHVEFAVKHMMITTVRGRFGSVSGEVFVDASNPGAPNLLVTIDASTIHTGEERRDNHLKSADFLEVEKYPTITFQARRIEGDPTDEFRLIGDLTIRDVTREVALKASFEGHRQDPWGGERLGFSASARVNRKDFGLRWNVALESGGVLVGDEVKINIDTELVLNAAARAA